MQGDLENGIPLARRGLDQVMKGGILHTLCVQIGRMAELEAASGDYAKASATLDEAIRTAHLHGDGFALSPLHCRRGEIMARLPSVDAAAVAAEYRTALIIAEAQGATAYAERARSLLAPVAA